MRAEAWATLAIAMCIASAGCGGESSVPGSPATRAGSQPLPSSQPAAVPASSSPQHPMFAGASQGDRFAAVAGSPRMQAFQEEQERMARTPQRLEDPQARGRELGEAMQRATAEAVAADATTDECEQAWIARAAMRDHLGIQGQGSRADFISACRTLPEAERHCMSPAYVTNHQDECHELQERQLETLRREGHIRDQDRPAPR